MNWEPPDVIRRRGQRRAAMRQTAILAGCFVAVALIGVGATLYVLRPTAAHILPGGSDLPAPTPTSHPKSIATLFKPSSSPTSTRLPADLMLDDAQVPDVLTGNDYPQGGYDGTLEPLVGRCGQGAALLQLTHATRDRSFQLTTGGSVYQVVHQYATAADAVRALDWYRGKVASCPSFDPGGGQRTLTIIAQNLAGDESMTVQDKRSGGTDLHVFVRVRNRLTEIVVNPGDTTVPVDATVTKVLALKAAFHLSSVQ
jgi:hypothetical protein